ncbi:tRNA 2-selenouridine(34) synthase MnmH [Ferrimonas sediminicola]|uniref:tRNA 2-selenouridine synthase n=1 Tax=Ferrimonas sediminicola TaxID=2569538 RepID=A0A4U1BCA0_9GAMM|nr:tRNA 2-selenouridine(34) synthase MnmH [Ferrimonas sediminicola]TKB47651.1 tRNA 2-selenouridine(34) synthase MnmH [Ferrimonas sediminicola]
MKTLGADHYQELLLSDRPLIDLRAPVEFAKGAFPNSINLPLMNDQERAAVGTCYKRQGQMAAIELGHKLVRGEVKAQRQQAWKRFLDQHPDAVLYCFRGGLRSELSQQWIAEVGHERPFIEGGYKGMRTFLMEQTDRITSETRMWIVGGMTGCGKTDFLKLRQDMIDLEGLANHRGSSFGRQVTEQPTQIDFENHLAVQLMRHRRAGQRQLVLEDESRLIGRVSLPLEMHGRMQQAPLVLLEVNQEERVERILRDYVTDIAAAFIRRDGDALGFSNFQDHLLSAMDRIRKRLGDQHHRELRAVMQQGFEDQLKGSLDAHRHWIQALLNHYYDPMYRHQLEQRLERVIFRGDHQAVHQWLDHKAQG